MNYRLEDLGCGEELRELLQDEISEVEIAAIESTIRPFLGITTISPPASALLPWQSHLGGLPYLPLGTAYPVIADKPAPLVAQINLAEVPSLEGFPTQGILQFYIADKPPGEWPRSWMVLPPSRPLAWDEIVAQTEATVLFFPEPVLTVDALTTDFSFLPEFEHPLITTVQHLRFQKKLAPLPEGALYALEELQDNDYFPENYDAAMSEIWERSEDEVMFRDALQLLRGDGTKLGGYPAFRQYDPRVEILPLLLGDRTEPCELLFCLDGEPGIMLHDVKIHFLIRSSDLQRQDFSRVLFYSDR